MWRPISRCAPRWFSPDAAAAAHSGGPARRRVAALWGNGDYGRLGRRALESRWSPTACPIFVARRGDPPASLACGGAHTLFLTLCGRVFAAGLNDFGHLGLLAVAEPARGLGFKAHVDFFNSAMPAKNPSRFRPIHPVAWANARSAPWLLVLTSA